MTIKFSYLNQAVGSSIERREHCKARHATPYDLIPCTSMTKMRVVFVLLLDPLNSPPSQILPTMRNRAPDCTGPSYVMFAMIPPL